MDEKIQAMNEFLSKGIELLAAITMAEYENRDKSKLGYDTLLLDAHLVATSVISSVAFRKNLVIGNTSESISGRLSLLASFIQGITLCETAISGGYYAQAANLLKQEMETVAAIEEYRKDRRTNRRTPNVKHLPMNLGKMYGELQKAAHVADFEVMQIIHRMEVDGEKKPASFVPVYNQEISKQLYSLHVVLIVLATVAYGELLTEMYDEGLNDLETEMLYSAFKRLEDAGYFDEGKKESSSHE